MSETEVERFVEPVMPNPAVQNLFDRAASLGIGFYVGYVEQTGAVIEV